MFSVLADEALYVDAGWQFGSGCAFFAPQYSQYPAKLQDVFRFGARSSVTSQCAEMAEEIVVSESERCGTSSTVGSSYQLTPLILAPLRPLLEVRGVYDKEKADLTCETRIEDRLSLRGCGS